MTITWPCPSMNMLRFDPDNEELWADFRQIDAGAADRLYRLHVADPFVGRSADTSDLDDFEEEAEERFVAESGPTVSPTAVDSPRVPTSSSTRTR